MEIKASEFARVLREARMEAKRTLRETGRSASLSVGYLSDIEQGRRSAPDLETVRRLQDFLNVTGDHLIVLAAEARKQRPAKIAEQIRKRPRLSELFLRAKNLSDQQLDELLADLPRRASDR